MTPFTDSLKGIRKVLKLHINFVYDSLLDKQSDFTFVDDIALNNAWGDIEKIEELVEECETICITGSSGHDYYAKLITVCKKNGIFVVLEEDVNSTRWVKFSDINSSYYEILVIEAMEKQLNS